MHRISIIENAAPLMAGELVIEGEEAHHAARVKRLREGETVEVLDGRGRVGSGVVVGMKKVSGGWRLTVRLAEVREVKPIVPRVEVLCPPPKGAHLSQLIEGLSQTGAAQWTPLVTAHSVSDARAERRERLERIATEASKQCGRAWRLEIGAPMTLGSALERAGARLVVADESGEPYTPSGIEEICLLVGPEGGWREDELAAARRARATLARFGPHTMRIETAAVVGTAIVLDAEMAGRSR